MIVEPLDVASEWLEVDGLGGYASGTVGGARSRRYHAILLTACHPPTGRMVLVNGFEAWVKTSHGTFPISTQHYIPDIYHPDGQKNLRSFRTDPWPTWRWEFGDGTIVEQEIFIPYEKSATILTWKIAASPDSVTLMIQPFLSGRDYHSLHRENSAFQFAGKQAGQKITFEPYKGVPANHWINNGRFRPDATWYRHFLYSVEQERGLDFLEDLASPGTLSWELNPGQPAICVFAAGGDDRHFDTGDQDIESIVDRVRSDELTRRRQFLSALDRSADAYMVKRGSGKTIIAGYPWFTDWGRDTFIALRGLCIATGRFDDAGQILEAWSKAVSEGMLPNRFPDQGDQPEYNSVDASLWFVIAAFEFLQLAKWSRRSVSDTLEANLLCAIDQILHGYWEGTRFGIRCDSDGLIAAGEPGVQLTWMDAKAGDWVVTPRIGKPVEIQALWLNALSIAGRTSRLWKERFEHGWQSFELRFWNSTSNCLYDIVDVDHEPGKVDSSIRPNQIFAVGGLPVSLISGDRARQIVDIVEVNLLTPIGLRTLAPSSPDFARIYLGGPRDRDAAYHQGTVWPWLMAAFVDAWLRVRGRTADSIQFAKERFLPPFYAHLRKAGLGHISEIVDAEVPYMPRGCPFQAWSLGEFIRLKRQILSDPDDLCHDIEFSRNGRSALGASPNRNE